jgi:EAL domain-containing protein (putative c-di-GMP-specific phosphodiesterase class I)
MSSEYSRQGVLAAVQEMPSGTWAQLPPHAAIADAIIAMAHRLGIRVIAEGVETEAQCEVLSGRMCDEIQGYLFSPALPADSVEQLIRSGKTLPAHLLARTCRAMNLA